MFAQHSLHLIVLNFDASARVFRPLVALQWRYYWLRLRIIFKSRKQKELAVGQWFEELLPVGLSPFDSLLSYKTRASEYCHFMSTLYYRLNIFLRSSRRL